MVKDELETEWGALGAPLEARQYRRLWLDAANDLGVIAEQLADVLGWQPDADNPLPDAVALADEATAQIALLQRLLGTTKHRAGREPASRAKVHA